VVVDVDVDGDGFGVEFLGDFRVLEGRDHCVGLLQGERRCHQFFSPTVQLSCSTLLVVVSSVISEVLTLTCRASFVVLLGVLGNQASFLNIYQI
jgi:hypothetical protein